MIHALATCLFTLTLLVLGAPSAAAQLLVAHRGASASAPENTLAAFREAWNQGADAVEGDFRLTKDGRIVCLHDATTERTSNVNLTVKDATLAELRELDVGTFFDPRFHAERIPSLDEVLKTLPENGRIFIEVKCGKEIVPELGKVLARAKLDPGQTSVIAFDREVIAEVRRCLPEIAAYWLTSYRRDEATGRWSPSPEEVLTTLRVTRATGLDTNANADIVTEEFVRRLREQQLEFHCWTVNDVDTAMRFRALGVDSITTDRPRWLRDSLPSGALRAHLLVHLPLDGDLKDSSGASLDGEWLGASGGVPFARGVFGRALQLGASKGAVKIPLRLPPEGTIALWVRTAPWYDHQTIFDNSRGENDWEMWVYRDARLAFRLQRDGRRHVHSLHPTGDVEEWIHVAVAWREVESDSREVTLFVDGWPSDESPQRTVKWTAPGEAFFLGGGHAGNDPGRGSFDDLMIFDRPLEKGDVRMIMKLGEAGL